MTLRICNARVVPGGTLPTIPCADVMVEGDRIVVVESEGTTAGKNLPVERVVDAAGRVLMPAFVDAHTHALWAGDRLDEFELKQRGADYLEILKAGGGIFSTVQAVRAASVAELSENLSQRLAAMLREGTTTVEIKSGYGLTTQSELAMLRAIREAARQFPGMVVPTALLGHAIDRNQAEFVNFVIEETLPAVHSEFPGIAIDAYCEVGAWSVNDCRRLFEKARSLGHPLRLHADQFHCLGGVGLAIELGAVSVDHLEATPDEDLIALARSGVYGVMLPASAFHLNGHYANARALLDAGGKLALATNCNPGSAPTSSMPMIIALAVRHLGLSILEAIAAVTSTPARLLGLTDRGRIEPNMRADLILLRHRDERLLGYEFGGNPVDLVVCGGEIVANAAGVAVRAM
ncbi:MAG: imidazolonepropionase [Pirellulales bacterium]|nr:imidazolonepropionase [Pirellulales bacterium]